MNSINTNYLPYKACLYFYTIVFVFTSDVNEIQSSFLNASSSVLSSADTVDAVNSRQPKVVSVPSMVSESNSEPSNPTSSVPVVQTDTDVSQSINQSAERIISVGDSILHRMNPNKKMILF